jgi:DNA-binding MarR family transcriptional regulator
MRPCNCYALRRATRRVTQFYDRALAPLDLRATQYSLLMEVERLGPISLIPLADAMVMDRATLGHNVRPLRALGYLTLSVGEDRRSRVVALTEAGREVMAEAKSLWAGAQRAFDAEIGTERAAEMRAMLHDLAERKLASA